MPTSLRALLPSQTSLRFVVIVVTSLVILFDCGLQLSALAKMDVELSGLGGSGFLLFTLSLAILLYRRRPNQLLRRMNAKAWPLETDPELQHDLRELARAQGITKPVAIYATPRWDTCNALALGTKAAPIIVLDQGVRVLHRKDPEATRALLAHELAHVALGDARYTHFSRELSRVAIASICLCAAGHLGQFLVPIFMPEASQTAAFSGLRLIWHWVYDFMIIGGPLHVFFWWVLIRLQIADLLRTRELAADEVASRLCGPSTLNRLLQQLPETAAPARWYTPFFASHPNTPNRRMGDGAQPARTYLWSLFLLSLAAVGMFEMLTTALGHPEFWRTLEEQGMAPEDIDSFLTFLFALSSDFTMALMQMAPGVGLLSVTILGLHQYLRRQPVAFWREVVAILGGAIIAMAAELPQKDAPNTPFEVHYTSALSAGFTGLTVTYLVLSLIMARSLAYVLPDTVRKTTGNRISLIVLIITVWSLAVSVPEMILWTHDPKDPMAIQVATEITSGQNDAVATMRTITLARTAFFIFVAAAAVTKLRCAKASQS